MSLENVSIVPLKDVVKRVKVGFVGSCNNDYCSSDEGVPMIRTTNLTTEGIKLENLKYINNTFHIAHKKSQLHFGDILIARHGHNGLASLWEYKFDAQCLNVVVVEPDESLANRYYLTYLINSPLIQKQIKSLTGGSVQSVINTKDIADLLIPIPSLDKQKEIADFISLFNKKISVCKSINKNLDELCHSLFKYYFIDFIPFCDDDFIDSDIGEIPKEWSITTVGNILDCKLGGTPSRSNESYWGGSIAWINSGKVNDFRIIEPSEYITEKGLKKSATKLLPAKTTVIAITGATLGQISLLEIDSCANQSVIGIIPNINYPYEFVYPLISSILIDLLKHQTGGAQQHINKNNVESFKIICPPAEIISEYKTIVSPIYSKISDNCFEIEKLQKLRDTLLPKLMSGEIDVSKINCDLKIIIRKIYIKSSKLFLWRYLSENKNYIKNTKSNETLLKSRTIYKINKFLAKFNARYRYYRQ